jgi:hypothetical protein
MSMFIENRLVVDVTPQYGVKYDGQPHAGLTQEFVTHAASLQEAQLKAAKLDGSVVERRVYSTQWESYIG